LDHLANRKLYISMGWIDTVKDFSILVPSYISESDICLRSVLNSSGKSSSTEIFPPFVEQVMPKGRKHDVKPCLWRTNATLSEGFAPFPLLDFGGATMVLKLMRWMSQGKSLATGLYEFIKLLPL